MRRPRVHTHCLPGNIVVGIDLRLHQQIVESMVAAHEDHGIYLLVLNKMHAVVDRPEQRSGELVDLDDPDNSVSRLVADRQIGLDESAEETIITFLACKKRL